MGTKGSALTHKPQIIPFNSVSVTELPVQFNDQSLTTRVVYEQQLKELHEIAFSELSLTEFIAHHEEVEGQGNWVYLPWKNEATHCVNKADFTRLKTARNQYLISFDEQQQLQQKRVAVAGMSAGFMVAQPLVMSMVVGALSIADHDTLDSTNLNRIPWPFYAVGQQKTELAAQALYELNPYLELQSLDGPITSESLREFADGANILVDEVDDFKIKVQLRIFAKEHGIPVVMATSLGDNVLLDVERYDIDPDLELFNGHLGEIPGEIMAQDNIDAELIKRYSVQLVGPQYVPTRALASVKDMGKKLTGRPQLFSTVSLAGDLSAYVIRDILLNQSDSVKSGRHFIELAKLVGHINDELADNEYRQTILQELRNGK